MAASRYHPLYDGLWDHPALEGAPFEEKGLFVFLFGNERQRPSGIYRITDEQIVALTGLPLKRVRVYLADLHTRRRIVRDGSWLFVRGYFSRQPNAPQLLRGVESDIAGCTSVRVLESFSEKYQKNQRAVQWVTDRLATIGQQSANGLPPEQYRAEQSTTEHKSNAPAPAPGAPSPGSPAFEIPPSIARALERAPLLGRALRDKPAWWQAQVRAYPGLDYAAEILKAEAWCRSNPDRAPRRRVARFLHEWFGRATRGWEER